MIVCAFVFFKAIMNNLPHSEMVDKCSIDGPGFVNVVISKDWIARVLFNF